MEAKCNELKKQLITMTTDMPAANKLREYSSDWMRKILATQPKYVYSQTVAPAYICGVVCMQAMFR